MSTAATAIREAIAERLMPLGIYKGPIRRAAVPQIQPADLPQLSVVIAGERLTPDGDENAGDLRFVSEITISIQDLRGFARTYDLDRMQDDAVDLIEATLLTDPNFTRMGPAALFEGISGLTRARMFPQQGETYFAELRLNITFRARADFGAQTVDDLRRVLFTARPASAPDDTMDVKARVDLPASDA